ncbi:MAG TPA: hypothetical protein VFF49_04580 [Thermodesulfobacteriota bacterium]|nr:hypothetical protein [Thermodesulfobacteriota bacterium]
MADAGLQQLGMKEKCHSRTYLAGIQKRKHGYPITALGYDSKSAF